MEPPVEFIEPQHVWVDVTGRWGADSVPGILFARHRTRRGWYGWVIQVRRGALAHGGDVSVTQGWIEAHLIKLAPTERPKFDASGFHPVNSDRDAKNRPAGR